MRKAVFSLHVPRFGFLLMAHHDGTFVVYFVDVLPAFHSF